MKKIRDKRQRLRAKGNTNSNSLGPHPLALVPASFAGIFGTIKNPLGNQFKDAGPYSTVTTGLPLFISNIVRVITLAGGIWMFFNLLTAGFMYITSNGEAEKINKAWAMIWQSLMGLLIIVAAFALTGIISLLLFGNASTILKPTLYGPGTP